MSTTVHIVSDVFDDQGVETSDIKNLNADGSIKNSLTIITTDESTTAQISGTGAVVNLSKASVTLDDGASATINGSELQISVGANSQTVVNGQFLNIAGRLSGQYRMRYQRRRHPQSLCRQWRDRLREIDDDRR